MRSGHPTVDDGMRSEHHPPAPVDARRLNEGTGARTRSARRAATTPTTAVPIRPATLKRLAAPETLPPRVQRFGPTIPLARVAAWSAERAWQGQGVRLYRWPSGHIVVTRVGTEADAWMLKAHRRRLLGTWARGATLHIVLDDLRWAAAHA